MKKFRIGLKNFYLLNENEYKESDEVKSKSRFTLNGITIEIRIPLPKKTCANWEQRIGENTGIIYKSLIITRNELFFIKEVFKKQIPVLCNLFRGNLLFDNIQVDNSTIFEIDKILTFISSQKITRETYIIR